MGFSPKTAGISRFLAFVAKISGSDMTAAFRRLGLDDGLHQVSHRCTDGDPPGGSMDFCPRDDSMQNVA